MGIPSSFPIFINTPENISISVCRPASRSCSVEKCVVSGIVIIFSSALYAFFHINAFCSRNGFQFPPKSDTNCFYMFAVSVASHSCTYNCLRQVIANIDPEFTPYFFCNVLRRAIMKPCLGKHSKFLFFHHPLPHAIPNLSSSFLVGIDGAAPFLDTAIADKTGTLQNT